MDPATWLTVLAPAAGLLWLFGLAGGWLAERLNQPRLVGAVVFGLLLGPSVMGHLAPQAHRYLFTGAATEHTALVEKQHEMHEAIEAAEASGVSEAYFPELRQRYERELDALRQTMDQSQTERRATIGGILAVPCLLVTLFITISRLIAAPNRPRLGEHLQAMAAGALVSAAAAAGLGWWLLDLGWLDPGAMPGHAWLIALTIGCAIPAPPIPAPHDAAARNPLWRWLFEPMLYALAGSQTALVADFQWVLVLATLFWFCDFKALGALIVTRGIRQRAWRPALGTAAMIGEGHALALTASVVMLTAGAITGPIMTALVIANVLGAAASPLAARLIRDFPDDR